MTLPPLDERTYFAITITLHPDMYGLSFENQYYSTYKCVKKKLSEICKEVILNPEATKDGNLHYHGILQINDEIIHKYKFADSIIIKIKDKLRYLRYNKKILGFVVIKKVDNYAKWNLYINKDKELMEDVLKLENDKKIKIHKIVNFEDDF